MCHSKYTGSSTDMTLEAIHKLLKYTDLGGVKCLRLDRGIQACMKLAFDAKFKRITKLERNKVSEKLRRKKPAKGLHSFTEKCQ